MINSTKKLQIGAVVIGRNEGKRLITCLESLLGSVDFVVYVDSGSTDNSLFEAAKREVDCVSLDLSIPFTAARARNEGAAYLLKKHHDLATIQFVDGDCEVQTKWLGFAQSFLEDNYGYAVVCGRRRERYPEQSIYNQLCDIEWNTPIGNALACGGNALIRVSAFNQVNGYRGDLIAGEEPEMCFRLREQGWIIARLDEEMTLHDAAITKFSQWWNRAKRAGYAYAEGAYLHGRSAEKYNVKQTLSILFWSALLPVMIVFLSVFNTVLLALFVIYPLQVFRLSFKNRLTIRSDRESFYYALSNVVGKFPQFVGMMKFAVNKWQGRRGTLIEYK